VSTTVVRRQPHGIKVQQTTITIARDEMERLRSEARAQGITVSRYVVEIIREAWDREATDIPQSDRIPA
jgi:predicted DNA binding CopG/RHH family protein